MGNDTHTSGLRIAAVVFVVAVIVRLGFVFIIAPAVHMKLGPANPSYYQHDGYQDLGMMLYRGGGLRFSPGAPLTVFRAPLYPAILAAFYGVTGGREIAVALANILLGATGCALCSLVAWRVFGSVVGFATGLVMALHPQFVLLTWTPWSEHAQFAFTSLFAFCLVLMFKKRTAAVGAVTGMALGFAVLCKGFLIALPILLVPAFLLTCHHSRNRSLLSVGTLVLGMLVVIGPWTLRNYAVSGHFIPVNTGTGYAYVVGNVQEHTNSVRMGNGIGEQTADRMARKNGLSTRSMGLHGSWYCDINWQADHYFTNVMKTDIASRPGAFVRKFAFGALRIWYFAATPPMSLVCAMVNLPLLILSVIAAPKVLRRPNALPVLIPVVYTTLAYAGILAEFRYSMPVSGLMIAWSIASIVILFGRGKLVESVSKSD